MTAIRMALSELRRLTAGRLPRLAVLAIILIPTMYAGLYLWANHDPYDRLSQVDAALVVEDQPATTAQGKKIHVGRQVADELMQDGSFGWSEVSSQDAVRGVENGTYSFALTIPKGFSAALASTSRFDPHRGTLELTTNDANNYLSHTIADQLLSQVSGTIARKVGEQAASSFLLGFSRLHDQLREAGNGAQRLADGLHRAARGSDRLARGASDLASGEQDLLAGQRRLHRGLRQAGAGADRLESGTADLASGLETLAARTSGLPSQTRRLASGADRVADGNEKIATAGDRVAQASSRFEGDLDEVRAHVRQRLRDSGVPRQDRQAILTRLDTLRRPVTQVDDRVQHVSGRLDRLAEGARRVANGSQRLHAAAGPLTKGIGRADRGAERLHTGAQGLAGGLSDAETGSARLVSGQSDAAEGATRLSQGVDKLGNGIDKARHGADRLARGLTNGLSSIPDLGADKRHDTARAIASPVRTKNVSQSSAGSYGAGLAPFFLALAAWIGAYVMFLLVRPLSVRALAARQSALRAAVAGWLTPAIVATAQVVVMVTVVQVAVGIDFAHSLRVGLFIVLAGAAFVAIVHMLNAWFGTAGQLLGLVLLVLQLVSAGGTFPWQTLPGPLQALHHVLPMSYAIEGLRHLMYNGSVTGIGRDVGVLTLYLVGSVVLTAVAAHRQRIWSVARIKPELAL